MKKLSAFIFLLAVLVGVMQPTVGWADKAAVEKILREGGIFRIKNRGSGRYATEATATGKLTGQSKITTAAQKLTQVWILTANNGSYTVRNASTGRFLNDQSGNPMVTSAGAKKYYLKYSEANAKSGNTDYVTLSWKSDFSGNDCLNENSGSRNILGWKANSPSVNDNYSDWVLEAVTDVSKDEIKAQLNKAGGAIEPTENGYVYLTNVAYGRVMSEGSGSHELSTLPQTAGDYSQVWQMVKKGTKWALRNALTERYVATQGGERSRAYKTVVSSNPSFTLSAGTDEFTPSYGFGDNNNVGLHNDGGHRVVGWDVNMPESQWIITKAEVDEAALAAARNNLAELTDFSGSNLQKIKNTLAIYFTNPGCTELKAEYQALSDAELTGLMSQPAGGSAGNYTPLPASVQAMALKVKNNSWGHREKEFRVYDYKPYSDDTQWNSDKLVGTGYMFSPQTGPTGISLKRGEAAFIYINSAGFVPSTKVEAMTTEGLSVTGPRQRLNPGLNMVVADNDSHLFIVYTITDTRKKLESVPALQIHIEGGRVNGYFDITRGHTNTDWLDMEKTLFKDQVIHLKNKYYQFNMDLAGVKDQLNRSEFAKKDADGTPMGIEGVLMRWDELVKCEHDLMGIDHYLDRFNCMLSASSSSKGNPYASTYGTYYPGVGDYLNYQRFTRGSEDDEGAPIWVVAHETGHIHQKAINMAGDTEMSVNFFSQVYRWLQGTNVGRGRPLSNPMADFHRGAFRDEYNIWTRSRVYFQLWLYYQLQGHHPKFYPELFAKLRNSPMTYSTNSNAPISGLDNYLKFAMFASDVAQEDLSEFFQFYGFFKPVKNHNTGDYHDNWFTTTQADIDKAIAYMRKYPKAHPGIFFIDERIRKIQAEGVGSKPGQMRLATSDDATPGDAREVGDVGMVTDFRNDLECSAYKVTDTNGRIAVDRNSGTGAVGFKVYDTTGKLVYVSNTYNFTIPATIVRQGYFVVCAFGNGKQQVLSGAEHVPANFLDPAKTITGISGVKVDAANDNGKVYDLSGRPAVDAEHGVRIENGKVVIK